MQTRRIIPSLLSLAVVSAIGMSGCTGIKPSSLKQPTNVSCIDLAHPVSFNQKHGIVGVVLTTRLERGPYWSERRDMNGTFYRAPEGGVESFRKDADPHAKSNFTRDGGFYLPNDPGLHVRIYTYDSNARAPVMVPPKDMTCADLKYSTDPSTRKISVKQMAAAGAVGGALGGATGRAISRSSNMSYGQAAGVGLAGGLLAGLFIAAISNANVGRIDLGKPILDKTFNKELHAYALHKVMLEKAPVKAPAPGTADHPGLPDKTTPSGQAGKSPK